MKKIIKPGIKTFTKICTNCNCEFTYELEDINTYSNTVSCPECGKVLSHENPLTKLSDKKTFYDYTPPITSDPDVPAPILYNLEDSCRSCYWAQSLKEGELYVGDIPCTWCSKNRFTCADTLTTSCSADDLCSKEGSSDDKIQSATYEPTYTYTLPTEHCESKPCDKEFYTCTAEGVSYEFAADRLGSYDSSSFDVKLFTEKTKTN